MSLLLVGGEVDAGLVRDRRAGLDLVGHDEILLSLVISDPYEIVNLGNDSVVFILQSIKVQGAW